MQPYKIKKKERNISIRIPENLRKLPLRLPKRLFTKNIHELKEREILAPFQPEDVDKG